MLRFLRIRRLAVIDAVDVEFGPGLNVLTGETGAGKSIIVEAVGLLLGGRASADLVRTGEETATIEAVFDRGAEELIVRRELTAQGRSRTFINGDLATASALRDLAAGLIELHGQHEHQTLLDPDTHLGLLDAFGDLEAETSETSVRYDAFRSTVTSLAEARRLAADRESRHDFVAFQLGELDRASLREGEDEELAATRQVLASAERVERLCEESYAALYESDGAALAALSGVWRRVGELAALDPAFQPYLDARDGIKGQLDDLARFLRHYADGIDASPARLQQVEERLALIERLKRKYGPTLGEAVARHDALRHELSDLTNASDRIKGLEDELATARTAFLNAAGTLSNRRQKAAGEFASALLRELGDLAMERTRFEVRFGEPLAESAWTAAGVDRAEFFLSPNPGEDLRPLARIVSGGELSRVMLAIKTLSARPRANRTSDLEGLVFDEVDAGIGGRVADVVGRKLQKLAANCQVLCITHLPQIAACADAHFHIAKDVRGGRTKTTVTRLGDAERAEEIGRLLGGSTTTDATRAAAREMLAERTRASTGQTTTEAKGESETGSRAKAKTRGARL